MSTESQAKRKPALKSPHGTGASGFVAPKILNPVINNPFEPPQRHFELDGKGRPTGKVLPGRRRSLYFIPVAKPKKSAPTNQPSLFEGLEDPVKREENHFINSVRDEVDRWRAQGWPNVTSTTRMLLEHWTGLHRERRFFFCQVEAAETAIWAYEVAHREGKTWVENQLREENEAYNQGLPRLALKMATGSGKTTVMAMLIAWQTLNRLANPQDPRGFTNTFLIVTPGITIRDRLRVLLPSDPNSLFTDRKADLVPVDQRDLMQQARIEIVNYHQFMPREKEQAARRTKEILAAGGPSPFTESPDEMVRRVTRSLGPGRNIMVINDEAHHCYIPRPSEQDQKLKGDERKEAEQRDEDARTWSSGLLAIHRKLGIRRVFDLSATPFFLGGSGYGEGKLFPWVASDFGLMDAIESSIVKAPRLPVDDNSLVTDQPVYRNIWPLIREDLPKAKKGEERAGEPDLPKELEGALQSLYANYTKRFEAWQAQDEAYRDPTPPVFIVVCNNTATSKLVFDHIAGWDKTLPNGQVVPVPGHLPLFSNVEGGLWRERPTTLLVDSRELESGEGLSPEFKKVAAREIEEFKAEYRQRFPGRSADAITETDLLREVMNTVGKPGKLGEHVRCVVSVSMLTEGWDTNTVTHILGVRAFGTQLLCEQVMGRGLRRTRYQAVKQTIDVNGTPLEIEAFPAEYAEILGIPFDFVAYEGGEGPSEPVNLTAVYAVPERSHLELRFPRIRGYRWEVPENRLEATFTLEHHMELSTADLPTLTENAPIVGPSETLSMDGLESLRPQHVAFHLARVILEHYFPSLEVHEDGTEVRLGVKSHLFPQLLSIVRRWMQECVHVGDGTFIQELMITDLAHKAAEKVFKAIVATSGGEKRLLPVPRPFDVWGSTSVVDLLTAKPTYETNPDKCPINRVVCDTDSWEQKMASVLESMTEVKTYAKNQGMGFSIPYVFKGRGRQYFPDFIARVDDGNPDLLNLIVEVSGLPKEEKAVKITTARDLWVPAVNNHGGFGRWAFLNITDPWNSESAIRDFLREQDAELAGAPLRSSLRA